MWAARSANEEMTALQREEREAWLSADRRHQGAYLHACATLQAMESAVILSGMTPVAGNDNALAPTQEVRRSSHWLRFVAGSAAIAACVAGLLYFGNPIRPGVDMDGAKMVALADGSNVLLGEGGRISSAMEKDSRRITLESGYATFHVAKDHGRPFIVQSGDVYAQATGTIYTVHRLSATGGEVRVSEGSVLVWARGRRTQAVVLHAGEALALDPAKLPTLAGQAGQAEPTRSPAPSIRQFSFDNVPIAVATARFNRVNRTQIVIADPAIGSTSIIGLFDADDPERFARAVSVVAQARLTHGKDRIVIEK
ncbi:MAG: hypothetical protein B7X90_13340 [Novosphingobium sp. 17-62-19]|nr:MAG: hypothetical protein B7X90_13340 [Novosphingobium sp. 17-62-19]